MTKGQKVLKDISFYSSSILITQAITVVAAVLTRKFLGPIQMGVWVFLQTILSYFEFTALGTVLAASYEIPLHNGRGDFEKSKRVTNAAFSFALIVSVAFAFLVIVYAFRKRGYVREELFYGYIALAGFVVLQRFSGLAITVVRAKKQFTIAGRQMLYSSIVNAFLVAILSYHFKIYGFLVAMAFSLLFNTGYLLWAARLRFQFTADWPEVGALIRYGFPLMLIGLFAAVFDTLDRLVITRFYGFKALGLYSVAIMALNYLNAIPNSVGIVTVSHLQEKVGAAGRIQALRKYVRKVDIGYGMLMMALVGTSWFLVPWLIRLVLPEFAQGIGALRYLVLGAYFAALSQGYSQLMYVIRKHKVLLLLLPAAGAAALLANWLAWRASLGVEGVAMAAAFAAFFYFTLLFFYGSMQVETFREALKRYAGVIGFFFFMLGLLFGIDRWIVVRASAAAPWIQAIVFTLFLSPFLWRGFRSLAHDTG